MNPPGDVQDFSHASTVVISTGNVQLKGTLTLPVGAKAVVLFAHGSGSSRFSPRNIFVADVLHAARIGSLLIDLLTPAEDANYATRFDIALLTSRLIGATYWLATASRTAGMRIGYFGASTGAAAALRAAAQFGGEIGAVVSRGGRPDLAGEDSLRKVLAPTMLIVGGDDAEVIQLNQIAYEYLSCEKQMQIIPGATHLFEEPGTLEEAARLAAEWFKGRL
ncbi:MAG: alpha/beta hydrolase [Burkholderiales bacterium]